MPDGSRLLHHCVQPLISRRPSLRVPNNTAKTHTSSDIYHAWASLPKFRMADFTPPCSLLTTATKFLSIATKSPPNLGLQSSLLTFSSVFLGASAANLHESPIVRGSVVAAESAVEQCVDLWKRCPHPPASHGSQIPVNALSPR